MDRVKHYREIIHRLMEEYQQLYASQPGSRSPDLARRPDMRNASAPRQSCEH